MPLPTLIATLCVGLLAGAAPAPSWDMTGYRPQDGLEAVAEGDSLVVRWEGERGQELRARLAVVDGTPTVRELAVRKEGGEWTTLGRDLVPEFGVTTGVRRTGHGLPHEHRWDVFWDAPLNHPEEVRRSTSPRSIADRGEVRTDGARLEVAFPGLTMGPFSGGLRFTVYRGTNLLRLEAIAATDEPSVAYIYEGGLKGLSGGLAPACLVARRAGPAAGVRDLRGRGRTSRSSCGRGTGSPIAGGKGGSVAVFPPPHQFFFARELEVNLGYVWYRRDGDGTFAVGVRQGESAEGYKPEWIEKVFSLYNAPPGTRQRMAVYFYAQPRRPGRLPGGGHGVHARRPLQAAARLQDDGHALPHGVHAGADRLGQPRHDAALDTDDAVDGHQHRPHLRLPRRRPSPRPRPAPAEGAGDLLRGLPPPLRRRVPDPAGRGGQRLPGRPLQHPVPRGRSTGRTVRGKDQPLVEDHPRYGKVYHVGDAARRVRDDEARGRPGLADAPAHQGLDRLSRTRSRTPTTSAATAGWARPSRRCRWTSRRGGSARCGASARSTT